MLNSIFLGNGLSKISQLRGKLLEILCNGYTQPQIKNKRKYLNNMHVIFCFQLGRKLVTRSEPPQAKKEKDDGADLASKEEEELAYYFTP